MRQEPRRIRVAAPTILGCFVSILLSGNTAVVAQQTDSQAIVIAELDWNGGRAIGHVLEILIEDRLGLEAELVQSSEPRTLPERMVSGQSEIDVFPDLWMPDHQENWDAFIGDDSEQSLRVNVTPYLGHQGLHIPVYLQTQYQIHHLRDLADPKIAAVFDSDGDGRGEYWAGPEGWTSSKLQVEKSRIYGFDQYFDPLFSGEEDYKQEFVSAYKEQQPALFYSYAPDWIHGKTLLAKLDEDSSTSSESQVYVAFRADLEQRHPRAARFLEQVTFTTEMVTGWILLMVEYELEPMEMASKWIELNQETVDSWFTGVD